MCVKVHNTAELSANGTDGKSSDGVDQQEALQSIGHSLLRDIPSTESPEGQTKRKSVL